MLESIRSHKRLLMIILALFIIPGLGFFGIHGLSGMFSTADKIAKVDGQVVSKQQFEQLMREQVNQMRQSLGGSIDASLLDTPAMRSILLEKIIDSLVVSHTAQKLHLTATDDVVKNQVMSFPWVQQLKQPDGTFDIKAYKAALSAHGITPEQFDSQIRANLAQEQLIQTVANSAVISQSLIKALMFQQMAQREIQTLAISPKEFRQQLKPSEAELNAYFEKNRIMFQTREYADIEYVELNSKMLKTPLPSEKQLKQYYDEHIKRFTKPEKIKTRHILISVNSQATEDEKKQALKKAENILREVKLRPEKFAEIAKTQSQDPGSAPTGGDLGFSERGMMVKPFEDAAFALKINEISNLVKSDFGYHIIQLIDRQAESVQPFDSVKKELVNELQTELNQKDFTDKKALFSELLNEHPDSLKTIANNLGLSIKQASISRNGLLVSDPLVSDPLVPKKALSNSPSTQSQNETLINNPKLINAAFADEVLNNKRNSSAIDIDSNTVVALRVNAFHPAKAQPYEEVKRAVKDKWLDQESLQLTEKTVKKYLNNPQLMASKLFSAPKTISFNTARDLGENAIRAIASIDLAQLQKGPAYVAARSEKNAITIFKINRIWPGKEVDQAITDSVNQQIKSLLSQSMLSNFLSQLKAKASIKRYVSEKPSGEVDHN